MVAWLTGQDALLSIETTWILFSYDLLLISSGSPVCFLGGFSMMGREYWYCQLDRPYFPQVNTDPLQFHRPPNFTTLYEKVGDAYYPRNG